MSGFAGRLLQQGREVERGSGLLLEGIERLRLDGSLGSVVRGRLIGLGEDIGKFRCALTGRPDGMRAGRQSLAVHGANRPGLGRVRRRHRDERQPGICRGQCRLRGILLRAALGRHRLDGLARSRIDREQGPLRQDHRRQDHDRHRRSRRRVFGHRSGNRDRQLSLAFGCVLPSFLDRALFGLDGNLSRLRRRLLASNLNLSAHLGFGHRDQERDPARIDLRRLRLSLGGRSRRHGRLGSRQRLVHLRIHLGGIDELGDGSRVLGGHGLSAAAAFPAAPALASPAAASVSGNANTSPPSRGSV